MSTFYRYRYSRVKWSLLLLLVLRSHDYFVASVPMNIDQSESSCTYHTVHALIRTCNILQYWDYRSPHALFIQINESYNGYRATADQSATLSEHGGRTSQSGNQSENNDMQHRKSPRRKRRAVLMLIRRILDRCCKNDMCTIDGVLNICMRTL